MDAFAAELPEVFAAEILPKLSPKNTLRLAQVNKVCRYTVWSEDNVRSLCAKFQETIPTIYGDTVSRFESFFGYPIHWAAAHRVLPAVRALLKSEEEAYKTVNGAGLTALHFAVGVGFGPYPGQNLEIVRMLIEAGADINKLTNDGSTPMRYAAQGHPEATKILIDAGADLNISSPLREAAKYAKYNGHLPDYCRRCQACADLLIQAGTTIPDDPDYDSEFDESYDSEMENFYLRRSL